ncbi:lasso peptide biosynthesis B2 protein [Caenimonas koreensis]|uniref:Lasso peptide biosynthesis B2 protein n=1 Tax=Caenimonas koreensis DSM 17982 TaxID=1121255 RepID=A0A844ARF6_9BURK|nr:lasso peptide biosynthesis B2 protein [Caenimonas koreensis]MRD46815.1 lasso peptide biosynthesis B2 protein [Caenimonas koreensis DSM 17982]
MTMASKWRRWHELPARERIVLVKAWLGLPVAWLLLRVMPFPSIQSHIRNRRVDQAARDSALAPIDLGRLIDMAARTSPVPSTCLTKSVLLCWMLRRRGVAHELIIGVRPGEAGLQAHAWVECEGSPVNDQGDISSRFHPLQYAAGTASLKDLL